MYNPFVSSTLSIRCKSSFPYSVNDCSYLPSDCRTSTHLIPSSQSCCCVCCCSSSYVCRNITNPRYLCGSRQSSLIQWSASRRFLILPEPDPYCCQGPVRGPCRKSCCGYVGERGFGGRRSGERKFRRLVAEEGRSCDFETAEMMLSLLIEDVGEEERYGVRERDCRSLRRVEFEAKGSDSDRFCRKERKKKENVGSDLLRSSLRSKYEALRIKSRESEAKSRRNEFRKSEDEEVLRSEKCRGRKSGSSCSSYYTCPSLDEDSESDSEIHVTNEAYKEESGEGYKRDAIKRGNVCYEGETKEKLRRHESSVGSHKTIESDWRKKSEKKLDELAIGEVCESSHNRVSNSHKQFDTADKKSNSFISESETTQQYSRRNDQNIGGSESTRKQKQFLETCEDDVKAVSSSRNRFSGREEKSTLAGSLILGKKPEQIKRDDRVSLRDDYRLSTEQSNQVSQLDDINVRRTDISQSQYEDRVKRQEGRYSVVSSSVQDTENRYSLKSEEDSRKMDSRRQFQQSSEISDDRVSRRDDYRSSTNQSNQVSQIQDLNVRRTNISQAQYEEKVKRRDDQSSVISSSVQDTRNRYYSKSEEDLRQMDSRGKFRQSVEVSDDRVSRRDDYRLSTEQSNELSQIQDTNVRRTNISHAQYEDKAKRREGRSSVISSSVQDTENRYYLQREEELRQMDTRRKSKQSTELSDDRVSQRGDFRSSTEHFDQSSQIQDTNVKKSNISLAQYENKVKRQEHISSVISSSVQDTKSQYYLQREDDLRQMDSRRKIQQLSETSAQTQYVQSDQQVSEKESFDMSTMMLGQSSDTQVTNIRTSSGNKISSEEAYSSMVVKSTEESRKRTETNDNRVLRFGSIKETGSTSHKASILQESFVLETPPNLDDETNSQAIAITPQSIIPITSSQSGFDSDPLGSAQRFQKSSSKIVGEFLANFTHEASTSHQQIEKSNSQEEMLVEGHKHDEKRLSEYVDGDFKLKSQDSKRSSGSSGVKGPSDEIWDEVAPSTQEPERTSLSQDIVVKRTGRSLWNVISDIVRLPWSSRSKTSTPKSGVRNSPDQSTKSEAWFSSHDRDETSDENTKRRNKGLSHESVPTPTQSQGEGYSSPSSKDKISPGKTPIESTTPKGSSSASTEENFKVEKLVSMPSLRIRRSPSVDDVAEVDKRTRGKEQVTVSSPISVKGSEVKLGGDMKRRTLQRTNQVIKDRFDEWEEAFTLETEQRKIDEAFMREALLEAKKAGDMWEVPVGAVLVQHGKIIARGYNLVEELRDSTAHAEMICIREGSNQLRTWRLADTTLYVTLEPCPMCAGAILQARVDTVVWGAPNKLLGADGSWIRLFPGGGDGGTSSELTEKPQAPIHPFHPKIAIRRGVLGTECADVMQQFFQLRRRKKDKKQLPDTPPTPPACLPISNHPTKILNRMQDAFHFIFCL